MTNPASPDDVVARWRPLTDAEYTVAQTRLSDAWRKLRRLVPDLESRMVGDDDLTAEAVQVLADAVIRLLKNPEGYTKGSVTIDDRSRTWELNGDFARSEIHFTQAELDGLTAAPTATRRAFSIMPS